jgi:N-acetylmuramic acid 6-phosphate etherase
VKKAIPQIARAIDLIANSLKRGGRLIYVGAGTSGRLGALDASECPPTFNTDPETVQFVIAGGTRALWSATEASEDSAQLGAADIKQRKPTKKDVVIGIAASGRTPYTIGATDEARRRGAKTVAVVCNANSPLEDAAELAIITEVGPEVVSGSTRMKAGTAQKMVLNMLTTGAMTRLGYVYGNLMVNVHLKNEKLVERGITILQRAAGIDREIAQTMLAESGNRVPVALVMIESKLDVRKAEAALKKESGNVRKAISRARKR